MGTVAAPFWTQGKYSSPFFHSPPTTNPETAAHCELLLCRALQPSIDKWNPLPRGTNLFYLLMCQKVSCQRFIEWHIIFMFTKYFFHSKINSVFLLSVLPWDPLYWAKNQSQIASPINAYKLQRSPGLILSFPSITCVFPGSQSPHPPGGGAGTRGTAWGHSCSVITDPCSQPL